MDSHEFRFLDSQGDPIYDPYPTVGSAGFDLDGVAALHLLDTGESEVGFEDVGSSLADESFFSGPIPGGEQSTGEFGEIITSGWFESGGLEFNNTFSDFFEFDFTSWSQWAYSNVTDNVTAGFQNQYGVITGSGAGDSRTFGVAYVDQQGKSRSTHYPKIGGGCSSIQIPLADQYYLRGKVNAEW